MKSYLYFLLGATLVFSSCGGKKEAAPTETPKVEAGKKFDLNAEKAIGIGRIEPEAKILKLYPEVAGIIEQILVKPGDEVKKGQVLLTLSRSVEEAQIDKAAAAISVQESQVKSVETQIQSQETQIRTQQVQVSGFDKDIAKARVAVQLAQKNFDRVSALLAKGADTKQNFDNAENQLLSAQAEVERLQAQKRNLEAQVDNLQAQVNNLRAQKSNAQTQISPLQADLKLQQAQKNRKEVLALRDGKVLSVDVTVGSYIGNSTMIGEFAPASPMNVVCEIDELFASKVAEGQKANVRLQGGADIVATGTVIQVAPYLKQKSLFSDELGKLEDRRVREVRVRLDKAPESILIGTRVDCEVIFR